MEDSIKKAFVFVVIVLLFTDIVSAATLYGMIKDEKGDTLPGANVYVIESGKTKFGAVADANGKYTIANMPAGTYTIEPKFIGYSTSAKTIKLKQDDNKKVDFVMKQTAVQLPEQVVEATRLPAEGGGGVGGSQQSGAGAGLAGGLPSRAQQTYTAPPQKSLQDMLKDSGSDVAQNRLSLNALTKTCSEDKDCGEGFICFGGICKSKNAQDSCQESDGTKSAGERYNNPFIKDIIVRENGKKEFDKCVCIYNGQSTTTKDLCESGLFTHVQENSCGNVPYEIIQCENGCSLGACISFDFDKSKLNVLERKVFDEYNGLTTELGKIGKVQFLTDENLRRQIYARIDLLSQDAYHAVYLHPSKYNLMMFVRVVDVQRALYSADYQNALIELNTKCKDCTEQGLADYKTQLGIEDKEQKYHGVVKKQEESFRNLIERDSVSDPLFVNDVRQNFFNLLTSNAAIPGSLVKARKLLSDARNSFAEKNRASMLEIYNQKNMQFSSEDYTALQQAYNEMAVNFLKAETLPFVGGAVQQVAAEAQAKRAAFATEDIFEDFDIKEIEQKAGGDENLFAAYMTLETANRIINTASVYGEGKKLAISAGVNKGEYECQQSINNEIDRAKVRIGAMLVLSSFGVRSLGGGDLSKVSIDSNSIKAYTLSDAFYAIRQNDVSLKEAAILVGGDDKHLGEDDLPDYSPLYSLKAKIKNLEIRGFKKLKAESDKGLAWYYVQDNKGKEAIFIGCVAAGSSWNWPGDTGAVMVSAEDAINYFEKLPLVRYELAMEKDVSSARYGQVQKIMDSNTLKLARAFRESAGTYPYNLAAYQQAVELYSGLIAKGYKYSSGEDNAVFNGKNKVYRDAQEELEDMVGGTWHDLNLADATTITALVEGTLTEMTNVLWMAARAKVAARLEPYLARVKPSVRRLAGVTLGASKEGQAGKGIVFSSSYQEFETKVAASVGKAGKTGRIAYFGKEGFKFVTEQGKEEIFSAAAQSGVQAVAPNAPFIGEVVGMVAELIGGGSVDLDAKLDARLGKDFRLNRDFVKSGQKFTDFQDFEQANRFTQELALPFFWKHYVDGKYSGKFAVDGTDGWEVKVTESGLGFSKPSGGDPKYGYDLVNVYSLEDFKNHQIRFVDNPQLNKELEFYREYISSIYSEGPFYVEGSFLSSLAYRRVQNNLGDDFSLRVIKATVTGDSSYLYIPADYSELEFDKKDIDLFVQKYIIGNEDPSKNEDPSEILLNTGLAITPQKTSTHPKTGEPLMMNARGTLQYGSRYAYAARFKLIWNNIYDEYYNSLTRRGLEIPDSVEYFGRLRYGYDIANPDQLLEEYNAAKGLDEKIRAALSMLLAGEHYETQDVSRTLLMPFGFHSGDQRTRYLKGLFNALRTSYDGHTFEELYKFKKNPITDLKIQIIKEKGFEGSSHHKIQTLKSYALNTLNDNSASPLARQEAFFFLYELEKARYGSGEVLQRSDIRILDNVGDAFPLDSSSSLFVNEGGIRFLHSFITPTSSPYYPGLPQLLKERLQFLEPGFREIYDDPLISQLHALPVNDDQRYSIALSSHRLIKRKPFFDAQRAIRFIFEEREQFASREIIGPNTQVILFTHKGGGFDNLALNELATKSFGAQNVGGLNFKGRDFKKGILDTIASSGKKTTIWFNGHGSNDALWLDSGLPDELASADADKKKINAISFEELGDVLLKIAERNNNDLSEINIMLDQCFSYDLGQNLYNYLYTRGVRKLPTFIGASNLNSYGYSAVFEGAIKSKHVPGSPLMGSDILDSELSILQSEHHKMSDFVIFVPDENSADLSVPTAGECSAVTCLPGGVEIGMVDNKGEGVA